MNTTTSTAPTLAPVSPSISRAAGAPAGSASRSTLLWVSVLILLAIGITFVARGYQLFQATMVLSYAIALLFAFFRFTPLGLAMRAAAQNAASSRLVGINVGRMLMLGWGLASAIGAVAGMMVAPVVFLDPDMMTGVLLYAFAGALIGGIDSPVGAVLGGFIVGVLENLMGTYVVGTELKLSVALVLIVGVLIVKPSGLMGRKLVTRV